MRDIVSTFIDYQISIVASSPQAATIFVVALDCLVVYALALQARKKATQGELMVVAGCIAIAVFTVLEFTGGGQ